jgi:ligand-binding sensor domain-containing protein
MRKDRPSWGDAAPIWRLRFPRPVVALVATAFSIGLLSLSPASAVSRQGSPAAPAAPGGAWKIMEPSNTGIPGNWVYSVAVDAADHAWMTADDPVWDEGGLGELKGSSWRQWTNVDGKAPTHDMRNLTFDAAGVAWMASRVGLLSFDGSKVRKVWSMKNAPWPTNVVRDFGWDSHGNLWVALNDVRTVHGGVARYDGTSWKVWTTANGLPWPAPWDQVSALEIDSQDRVWIGSPVMGGAMFDGKKWTALGNGSGYSVYDIAIAPDGTPWYGFISTGVMTWSGTTWVDRTGPFGTDSVSLVKVDREGRIWVGTFIGTIWRWSGSGSEWDLSYSPPSLQTHLYGLAFDSKNRPWIGGIGGIAIRRSNGQWSAYDSYNTGLPSRWVDDIMIDASGTAWVSNAGGGIGAYDGKRWTDFNPYNWGSAPWPFATDSATSSARAPDGSIWVSPTSQGVGRWDGTAWTGYLDHQDIIALAAASNGTIWAAPKYQGPVVERWNGKSWATLAIPGGSEPQDVSTDAAGNLWVAGYGLLKYDGQTWTVYDTSNSGLPSNGVTTVAAAPGGVLWVGTDAGIARFDGTKWTVYTEADGIPADYITSVSIAPNGHVWIGAWEGDHYPYHGGVGDFDGAAWTAYTRENSPLPHNQVESVAVDALGRVWIGTASEGMALLTPAG